MTEKIEFGFPGFASTLCAAHGAALKLADAHSRLANDMLAALPSTLRIDQAVIYFLVRMVTSGWVELLILVGNGAGIGAMKISRGMFESAVMAEYLKQVPSEIDDYINYWPILQLRRLNYYPEPVPQGLVADAEREYERVKTQFQDQRGKVRNSWNKHPISHMAEKIGRRDQYDLAYSVATSVHHGNFEGMTAHFSGSKSALDFDSPPSLAWVRQALVSGHTYLLQALHTLNDLLRLGFDERLRRAGEEFENVWRKPD